MRSRGFSLIEMFFGLIISVVILTTFTELFLYCKRTHNFNRSLSTIQNNFRFLSFYLRNNIQEAGFIGDGRFSNRLLFDHYHVFKVYEGKGKVWFPALPTGSKLNPKPNTDVIMIRKIEGHGALLESIVHTDHLLVKGRAIFKAGDEVVLSNCHHAVLVHLKTVSKIQTNVYLLITAKKITDSFEKDAMVGVFNTRIYFLRAVSQKDSFGHKVYSLYEMSKGRKAELARSIDSFKVICYVKMNRHILQEMVPGEVTDWSSVRAIRIDLIAKSLIGSVQKSLSIYVPLLERR